MPSDVQPGDLVLVAANGRVFYARVLGYNRMLWTASLRKKAAYLPG